MRVLLLTTAVLSILLAACSCETTESTTGVEWLEGKLHGPLANATPRQKGELLTDPDPDTRRTAIQALARDARGSEPKFKARVALIFIEKLDQEREPILRSLIINELVDFAGQSASNAYIACLVDPSPNVRADAIQALRHVRQDAALVYLKKLATEDPDILVRQQAIAAVGELASRSEAEPVLLQLAENPNDHIAIAARGQLSLMDPEKYPPAKTKPWWQLW